MMQSALQKSQGRVKPNQHHINAMINANLCQHTNCVTLLVPACHLPKTGLRNDAIYALHDLHKLLHLMHDNCLGLLNTSTVTAEHQWDCHHDTVLMHDQQTVLRTDCDISGQLVCYSSA